MVLLWGISSDGPFAAVRDELQRIGVANRLLDQQTLLRSKISLSFEGVPGGTLTTPDWSADLSAFTAIYLRPYDPRRLAALSGLKPDSPRKLRALVFEDTLTCWLEITSARVVNRPSAMASNNSKPYQLSLIHSHGFAVPETLVTTDPAAALAFWERHGTAVYKSVSGVRSIVTQLRDEHRQRLQDVAHCPTQFQQFISGPDFRIHVVGDEVFGCEIRSGADDYRYPDRQGANVEVSSYDVPPELAERCRKLAASLNLPVAGLDLRLADSGNWFCFEVNPSPGFSFYEEATGQPIANAVARLLASAGE